MWSLFNGAICTSHHIASNYMRIVNSELQTLWKEAVVAESKESYPLPVGLKKTKEDLRKVRAWLNSNRTHPKHKSESSLESFCSLYILLQWKIMIFSVRNSMICAIIQIPIFILCVWSVYLYFIDFSLLGHVHFPPQQFHITHQEIRFLLFGVDAVNRLIRISHCSSKYVVLPWIILKEKQRPFCCRR